MTRPHLVACTACSRHVRVSESECPFCGSAIPRDLRESQAPIPPRVRLTRAALLAAGTLAVSTTAGCGGDVAGNGPAGGDAAANDAGYNSYPPYGLPPMLDGDVPPPQDASSTSATDARVVADAGTDAGQSINPPYGTPPMWDGGVPSSDASASGGLDASATGGFDSGSDANVIVPYGVPPHP